MGPDATTSFHYWAVPQLKISYKNSNFKNKCEYTIMVSSHSPEEEPGLGTKGCMLLNGNLPTTSPKQGRGLHEWVVWFHHTGCNQRLELMTCSHCMGTVPNETNRIRPGIIYYTEMFTLVQDIKRNHKGLFTLHGNGFWTGTRNRTESNGF